MNHATPSSTASPASAWAHHLAAPVASPVSALSEVEALRVQRYRDQLLTALQAHDQAALHSAKQAVLRATYGPPGASSGPPASAALRAALRDLSWHMAILLLPRHPTGPLNH